MSNLFSRPKMPQVVVTPPYTTTRSTSTQSPSADTAQQDDKNDTDQERVNQIMSRHRGRAGTIGTSFRGVLNDTISDNTIRQATANAQNMLTRKTLLGD